MAFNGFVNSFTNSPIQPANVTYLNLVFAGASTTIQLEWAFQNPATVNPCAQFIQMTGAGVNAYAITLPNALYSSTVQSSIFYNQAAVAITLYNFTGTVIGVCQPGIAYFVGNTDNTTSTGDWVFLTLAAGTSTAIASNLIDPSANAFGELNAGGLKAYTQFLKINQSIFDYAGAAYAQNTSDLGTIVNWTGGAGAYNLLPANSVSNGFITGLSNQSTTGGVISIVPNGANNLDGTNLPLEMQPNESTYLVSDGTNNWFTFCYSSNVDYVISQITSNIDAGGPVIVSLIDATYQIQKFIGSYDAPTYPIVTVVLPSNLVQQFFIYNASQTNEISIYMAGDENNLQYQYLIPTNGRLTTFTDGIHLYSSPNFFGISTVYAGTGTVAAPSITFTAGTTTGLSLNTVAGLTDGALRISQDAIEVSDFLTSGIYSYTQYLAPINTIAYSFQGFNQTGMGYASATNTLQFSVANTPIITISPTLVTSNQMVNTTASYQQDLINIYSIMRAYSV